jgi:hypothetical protein
MQAKLQSRPDLLLLLSLLLAILLTPVLDQGNWWRLVPSFALQTEGGSNPKRACAV